VSMTTHATPERILLSEGVKLWAGADYTAIRRWEDEALLKPEEWFADGWMMLATLSPSLREARGLLLIMRKAWPRLPQEVRLHWEKIFAQLDILLVVHGAQTLWHKAWPQIKQEGGGGRKPEEHGGWLKHGGDN
jgi:hypothetical protein